MLFPVYDEDSLPYSDFRPWVTWSLVGVNTLIAIFLQMMSVDVVLAIAYQFGIVAGFITGSASLEGMDLFIRPELTLFTYSFVHATWLHLVANMLLLWVFGDNIEKATGHLRFLAFYLLCQIAGGLAQIVSDPGSVVPSIGASGAVSGVVAAYLLVRPHARIVMLVLGVMTINLRAYWVIAAWVVWQMASFLFYRSTTEVAYWSHFGGFIAGALLIIPMRRPGVKILEGLRPRSAIRLAVASIRRILRRFRAIVTAWRLRWLRG